MWSGNNVWSYNPLFPEEELILVSVIIIWYIWDEVKFIMSLPIDFYSKYVPVLKEENRIVIAVDNAANDRVYPQMADFTFYGGLYRDVNIICVSESHFDLEYYGGPGIMVTPKVDGENAKVEIETFVKDIDFI